MSVHVPTDVTISLASTNVFKSDNTNDTIELGTIEKFLTYVQSFFAIQEQEQYWDIAIEKLCQFKLAKDQKEFWDLYRMAHYLEIPGVAHALAREYLRENHEKLNKSELFNPPYNLSEQARVTLRKHYFLMTDDASVMRYTDPCGQQVTITLTLNEVVYVRRLYVDNSKVDLSGLFLNSIDGIEVIARSKVQQVDLSNNFLTRVTYKIRDIKTLKSLDLSHNNLESIPDTIGELPNLEKLDMSFNKLASLPEKLGQLRNLCRLNVGHNELVSIPETLGSCTKLRRLELDHNNLTSLPDSLGNLSQLGRLHVHENRLLSLPENLDKLNKLRVLTIRENKIKELPEIFKNHKAIHVKPQ